MNTSRRILAVLGFALPLLAGCDLPGRPKPLPEVPRPEEVQSFGVLYGENCAGCHGANGQNGAATNLANPNYQAWIDDAALRDVIANGESGTLMPAFSTRRGGVLTDEQIDAIVRAMRSRWAKPNPFAGATPPPYKAKGPGDASKGEVVYAAACAQCHGASARRPGNAGSILDGTFLALVNEQMLRTTIVAGRPDIGEPDWRGHIAGRAMTDDEITNVTAWVIAQRPATPGQPYPATSPSAETRLEPQPKVTGPGKH